MEFTPAQLIFTLSYKSDRLIFTSNSSRSNKTISKYIPGNQKHLTLDDRIYIQNELSKDTFFKGIARIICKEPTTISKDVKAHRLSNWYHKGTLYNAKNFYVHRHNYKETTICRKILFGVSSVLHALPATKPTLTWKVTLQPAW